MERVQKLAFVLMHPFYLQSKRVFGLTGYPVFAAIMAGQSLLVVELDGPPFIA